jgi:hypothetical protein
MLWSRALMAPRMPSNSSPPTLVAVVAEPGLRSAIPPASWFRQPPPRPVDTKRLVRTSYRSRTGRNLVGIGLALGVPLIVIELFAIREDPGRLVILVPATIFAAFMVAVPIVPAVRLARALRVGHVAHATVTDVTVRPPGYGPTIDAMTNGFAAGQYRLADGGREKIAFESDAPWATRLQPGTRIAVLVEPASGRPLWILGPADDQDATESSDRDGSRTMPGR